MKPLFLCPGDTIKVATDAAISSTLFLLGRTPASKLEDAELFLLNCQAIPKGTVLEVSQIYIKNRNNPDNAVTFKVVDGTMFSEYNKYMLKNEVAELESGLDQLKSKLDLLSEVSAERTELIYAIKNRQKRLDSLKKKSIKKGFTKLIRISLTDIESWEIKPAA